MKTARATHWSEVQQGDMILYPSESQGGELTEHWVISRRVSRRGRHVSVTLADQSVSSPVLFVVGAASDEMLPEAEREWDQLQVAANKELSGMIDWSIITR